MPPEFFAIRPIIRLSTHGTVYTARGWCLCLLFICCLSGSSKVSAQWPQLLGPNRDGSLTSPIRLDELPQTMNRLWTSEAGDGFSGPAVVDGIVFLLERNEDKEVLRAISFKTGKTNWKVSWPARYVGGLDTGPRAVPLIHQGRAYCYGAAGDLACPRISDGRCSVVNST